MLHPHNSHTLQTGFPVTSRHAVPWCVERLGRSVRGALLLAAVLHPHERTGGCEESDRGSGAKSADSAAAAAASCEPGACGRSRELPVRLYSRGGKHGQLHGTDKELGAVSVPMLCAEAGSRHEVALFEERICDLQ